MICRERGMEDRCGLLEFASQPDVDSIFSGGVSGGSNIINEGLGPLQVIKLRFDTTAVSRSGRPEMQARTPSYTFVLQLSGRAELRQAGQTASLEAGDLTLYDQQLNFHYQCHGPAEVILLRVPAKLLSQSLPVPAALCALRLGCDDALVATANAMALALTEQLREGLDEFSRRRIANHLLGVISSCFAPEMDRLADKSSLMSNRLWQVKLCVEQHLRDPGLSPAYVAKELKISSRYLRMIFATGGESILAYILRRRLDECAARLADPQWRGHSITEIAFSFGFNSAPWPEPGGQSHTQTFHIAEAFGAERHPQERFDVQGTGQVRGRTQLGETPRG
jgi:AraC family transcriptional activator of tynA and feaB